MLIFICSFASKLTKMRKVIAMGETILDILFRNQQPIAAVPGGSCFNSIISLGRTGTPSIFVGYSGNDTVGRQTMDFLKDNGVNIDYFTLRENEKSAVSLAHLNDNGDASYTFYKNPPMVSDDVVTPDFNNSDVMLFGSYYAACKGTRSFIEKMLNKAKISDSIVYYDLNFRSSHKHELEALTPTLIKNFCSSTIVRGSADDFDVMYGLRDAQEIYEKHIGAYCKLFICTSGPGLITVCTPGAIYKFEVPQIDAVSTVGAGDNFNAGFVFALINKGITMGDLHGWMSEDTEKARKAWEALVEKGSEFASEVCQSNNNSVSMEFAKRQKA